MEALIRRSPPRAGPRALSEYLIRRLAFSLTAMLGVITIVFILLHVSGDPASLLVTQDATRQDMERIRQAAERLSP